MKTPRLLPPTDLANIAPIEDKALKRRRLEAFKGGHPPYRLAPLRAHAADILGVAYGPLFPGAVARDPWESIQDRITKDCRSAAEADANLRVAEGLYRFAEEKDLKGRRHDFMALPISLGAKVSFWTPAVIALEGRPTVVFIDGRRTSRLSPAGRRFALSVMHERVRVLDPDFAEAQLAVLQFAITDEGPRPVQVHTDAAVPLYSYDDLDEMIRETYALWIEVQEEREERTRKAAGGGGSLL